MATENDIQQRLVSMTDPERSDLLLKLICALHDEDTDQCYKLLREADLEQYQIDNIHKCSVCKTNDVEGIGNICWQCAGKIIDG